MANQSASVWIMVLEFIPRELDLWEYARGVQLDFSRPGKPMDNAFIESFNSRFRQECLN
jgi:putative transposase